MFTKLLKTEDDRALMIARMVLGFVFFVRGAQGLPGWFGGFGFSDSLNSFIHLVSVPAPLALLGIMAEFFGGIGLMAGIFSRIAAISIAADMVLTLIVWGVEPNLFMNWSIIQGGEGIEYYLLALALASILIVKGAGAFSLDRVVFCWKLRNNAPQATNLFADREQSGPNERSSRDKPPLHIHAPALPMEVIEGGKRKAR